MFLKLLLILLSIATYSHPPQSANETAVVRAVLFYSPTCGHCELVIRETILPLTEQYGEQFLIIGVDTTKPQGQVLYESAREYFNLEFRGVPFLVIGDEYLSGSVEIPEKLPDTVKKYMGQGGVNWPAIPGLQDAIYSSQTAQVPTLTPLPPTSSASSPSAPTPGPIIDEPSTPYSTQVESNTTVWQRILFDPLGNGLAIIALLIMIVILIRAIFSYNSIPTILPSTLKQAFIPLLCIIGLGIASYLAYIEAAQTTAICGPVGDCNTVQQSEYARLFGILPIGVIGVAGYLAILFSWGLGKIQKKSLITFGKLASFGFSAFGFLFSIYLTFLEPFVIGATCAWCLTSAAILTALFLLTLNEIKGMVLEPSH